MATPLEIITVRNPDFASDPNVNFYINLAASKISGCFTGDIRNEALALVAMHMATLDSRSGGGNAVGKVKSEKEGDLARTFGSTSSKDSDIPPYWAQTTWGTEYWQLVNSSFMLPRNRFTDEC
jgi:hypothetical protein